MDEIFFRYKSMQYIVSLLKKQPKVFAKRNVDVSDAFTAVMRTISPSHYNRIKRAILSHKDIPDTFVDDVEKFFLHNSLDPTYRFDNFIKAQSPFIANLLLPFLEAALKRRKAPPSCEFSRRFADMTNALKLTPGEQDVMLMIFMRQEMTGLFSEGFRDDVFWDAKQMSDTIVACTDMSHLEARAISSSDGNLTALGLIRSRGANYNFEVNKGITSFLTGTQRGVTFSSAIFEEVDLTEKAYRPINIEEAEWVVLKKLVSSPAGVNILLYGKPGTGKTSLVKKLAQECGQQILAIRSSSDGAQDERISNLLCAIKYAERAENQIILVDEADRLLCTHYSWAHFGERSDKGWLNKTLERSKAKIIWVTNTIFGTEPETMRRFSYTIEFKNYTKQQRLVIWDAILDELPEMGAKITAEQRKNFAAIYPLEPAQIRNAIDHALMSADETSPFQAVLEQFLTSHVKRTGRSVVRHTGWSEVCRQHSLEGLNADYNLEQATATLRNFMEALQANPESPDIKNMNVLLSGHPGTGKTQFARYLAGALGREILIKTASDLQSMWVGETEKNIAAAFKEAESSSSILFIDEADSFLFGRENAQRSWEVSHVNEFLCQMENFRGILICASNYMDRFDDASIRRFNLKIRFDWLKPEGVVSFFNRYFKEYVDTDTLSESQYRRLGELRMLAPGDFKVVQQKNAFLPKEQLTMDKLIEELEIEQKYKTSRKARPIGF